jgi:hypothetical protein
MSEIEEYKERCLADIKEKATQDPTTCQHPNFATITVVSRITGNEAPDAPMQYGYVEVLVSCADCATPFHFYGVDGGLSPNRPMCSPDACELRAPIREGAADLLTNMKFEIFRNDLTELKGVN